MSISAPRYAGLAVPRTHRSSRILAIASREFFRRGTWGTLAGVTLTYMAVVLIVTITVFVTSVVGGVSAATFETAFESPVWPFLILIVATAAGAGSLADDVGNRSITLYLSRPIELLDYLLAKTIACGGWLLIAAVGPGVFAVAISAALGYANTSVLLGALAGFLATGIVAAVFFTGLALALSSLTNRALYSGVAIFGLVLSVYIGASVVAGITGNVYVPYANPIDDIHTVAHAAFGVSGTTVTDPVVCATTLLFAGVFLWILAFWRVTRIEVVSE